MEAVPAKSRKESAPKFCGGSSQESSHTNPFQKIPDLRFASIYVFQRIFHKICWAWAIFRRIIKLYLTDGRTDGQTDELIWGGLGNLRSVIGHGDPFIAKRRALLK
jgi:hypothetical protein